MERDICQPIYISVKENDRFRFFILLIEDSELAKNNVPERFTYSISWGFQPLNYFSSAEEAYKHALLLFPKDKTIDRVTSLSMNEFLIDAQLIQSAI